MKLLRRPSQIARNALGDFRPLPVPQRASASSSDRWGDGTQCTAMLPPSLLILWPSEHHTCSNPTVGRAQHFPKCGAQKDPGCLLKNSDSWATPRPTESELGEGEEANRNPHFNKRAGQVVATRRFENHQYSLIKTIQFYLKSPVSQLFFFLRLRRNER